MVNPDGNIICCLECGRDTAARYGVCARCLGCGSKFDTSEFKGRSCRSSQLLGGTAEMCGDGDDHRDDLEFMNGGFVDNWD